MAAESRVNPAQVKKAVAALAKAARALSAATFRAPGPSQPSRSFSLAPRAALADAM